MENAPSAIKTFLLRILSLVFVLMCGLFATFMLYFLVVLFQNGFNLEVISKSMSSMLSEPSQIRIVQTIQSFCIFILPPFVLCKLYGVPTSRFLSLKLPGWKPALMGMLSIVVLMPLLNAVVAWNQGLHLPDFMQGVESWMRESENSAKIVTDKLLAGTSLVDLFLNLIIVAVLAGIGEELFFRGLLMRILTDVLKKKLGSTMKPWVMHASIWTIAILFSAIHMQFFGFFPRMLIGAWFGYLLWWTGSIWVPVLAHFLNNALSTLTVFGQNKGVLTDAPDRWGLDQTWWLSLISLLLAAVTIRYFVALKKNR
jgi:membrane protease YdiL (CAAX protease family)